MNVLITDVSSYKGVVVAKFIKTNYPNIKIFTCDSRSLTRYFHTRYSDEHIVLEANLDSPKAYCDEVSMLVLEKNIEIMIPINSAEMAILLPARKMFGSAMSYWGSMDAFLLLNTKEKLYRFCLQNGIDHPNCFENLNNVTYPLVIKPSISSSSKGVHYCHNESQYKQSLKSLKKNEVVVQRYVSGVGVGYSIFAVDGKIVVGYGHERLAEYPVSGGSSMYRRKFDDSQMQTIAEKIVKKTNWSGFAMFEYKLTADGSIILIEVNPRIWGSINQGLADGTNFFRRLLGESFSEKKYSSTKYTYYTPFIYLTLFLYLLKGKIGPAQLFLSNFRKNEADISFVDDIRGWVSGLLRLN